MRPAYAMLFWLITAFLAPAETSAPAVAIEMKETGRERYEVKLLNRGTQPIAITVSVECLMSGEWCEINYDAFAEKLTKSARVFKLEAGADIKRPFDVAKNLGYLPIKIGKYRLVARALASPGGAAMGIAVSPAFEVAK